METSKQEQVVRITTGGKMRNYVSYAITQLNEENGEILLKGEGKAVTKCISTAEILKRSMKLHQVTEIHSIAASHPNRNNTVAISILLSRNSKFPSHASYQAPLTNSPIVPEDNPTEPNFKPVKELHQPKQRGRRGSHFVPQD